MRWMPVALIALGGCATFPLERAAFEFDCPQDKLTVTDLGLHERGVEGCGQRAVYIRVPSTGQWINNTATQKK